MRRALGLGMTAVLAACRAPTQISVTIQTDVPCSAVTSTGFTSGELGVIETDPPTTESTTCTDGHLGTIVLVPSGEDDAEVGFKVVTALDGETVETCSSAAGAGNSSCIVSRRELRYLAHTRLEVIVDMTRACEGVVCDPRSTCVDKQCKSATIPDPAACEGSGCNATVLGPAVGDGGTDAAAIDATVFDATLDGSDSSVLDSTIPSDAALDDSSEPAEASPLPTVVGCDLGGLQQGSPWPMEGYCPSGRSRSPLAGPAASPLPVQKWFVDLNGYAYATPSVAADGTIFVPSVGLPQPDADTGYIGGAVTAVHPDGSVYWTYAPDAGANFSQVPVIAADSTLRFWEYASQTYTVLALDGSVRSSVKGPVYSRGGITIVSDGTMYVPDNGDNSLAALAADGSVQWSVPDVISDFTFPSVGANGAIFVDDTRSSATSVDPDGGLQWTVLIDAGAPSNWLWSPLVVAPDGTLRFYDGNGQLWSLDPQTGHRIWNYVFANPGDIAGLAVGDDGTTYLGTREGLIAVDATGAEKNHPTGNFGAPVIDKNGDVYTYCNGTDVCWYNATLSTLRWEITLQYPLSYDEGAKPVIGVGGMLYVMTNVVHVAGRLHAIGPGP